MSALYGPLRLGPVMDRLNAELTGWKFIGGLADLEQAEKSTSPVTPAAYVLMGSDRIGARADTSMRIRQRSTAIFGVVVALRDYRASKRSADKLDELAARIGEIRAALVGWTHPDGEGRPTVLQGTGGAMGFKHSTLWWRDNFATEYTIRNA